MRQEVAALEAESVDALRHLSPEEEAIEHARP